MNHCGDLIAWRLLMHDIQEMQGWAQYAKA
jgi:hypothetical protein